MDKITIENILEPISLKNFFQNYWGKKHLVIRRNKFKNLFTWNDFDNYLNRYPNVKSLQIIDGANTKDGRWCLDKILKGKLKLPMLSKEKIYNFWKKENKTFVIPFAEYEKKELVDICMEFERFFGHGQVNVYASHAKDSKSFPAHGDATENFLFHTEGKTKWTIYKEYIPNKPETIIDEFILEPGDLLYIPAYQYHTLKDFKITPHSANTRAKWYNWAPYKRVKRTVKIQHNRSNKSHWSKPYFNKKI
jgi:ribosomal protein L16 Arg81 hydroxylase